MTTTVSQEAREAEVTVTQADRAAAQAILDTWFNRSVIETILARHRQSAERAFEERERKLREQLARYEGGAGPDDWRECPGQCGESCCGYHDACRRALATRQDAPVTETSHDQ